METDGTMAEVSTVSMNTAWLMNIPKDRVEQALSEGKARRAEAFERLSKMYPEVNIDEAFLYDVVRTEREDKACLQCTGCPCTKITNKGFRNVVIKDGDTLHIVTKECEYRIAERRQALINRRFKMAKIPPVYVGKTFKDYEVNDSNRNAVSWAKAAIKSDIGLYIFGRPGTGKTFLASIIAQEMLKQNKSVIFGDVPSLLDQLRGTFDDTSNSTIDELMQMLSEVEMLILDDLGTETSTEWAVERLYLLINSRYNAGKPVIITSNYDLKMAAEKLNKPKNAPEGITGTRIASRLRQMCKIVVLSGTDRRF